MSPHLPNFSNPSGPALRNKYLADEIASACPLQFQQALLSLQQHPKSFIHAWLLMAKSLGLSARSVREHYREGSALPIEQLQAIVILQELPHDQVLACIQDREKRTSRRPPSNCLGNLIEASEIDILPQDQPVTRSSLSDAGISATPQQTEKNCSYKCTGCNRTFKSMQTWARHEKEDHEDISFPCMPYGAIEITGCGRACALCGQEPTEEHLRGHNIERCTQLKQVFKRSDHLKQHLESHGLARKSRQSELLVTKWQRVPDKQAWACGFCKAVSSSLVDFHKHVAGQHYERGEDRKWDYTKVILGLLSQAHIVGPWERLLASSFKVEFLSCKWSKSKSGCLQTRLELGQEPGEVLAQAALDCAIYDRDLLHEASRPQESSTSGMSKTSSPTVSGPPVPPKPSFVQEPSHAEDVFGSNAGQGSVDLMALSSFDHFKIPSPPLLDLSPRAWEFYMSHLDQTDRVDDWNSYDDPEAIQPMDVDVGTSNGYPS
ncbi:MAG: hypothetical protein Q9205_002419 [Flavoplaca limonia]